jgi:hypothetical protein
MSNGGFSTSDATSILMKRNLWLANTGSGTRMYNEDDSVPIIWQKQLCAKPIPDVPPTDFSTLSDLEIESIFGLDSGELAYFQVLGSPSFSIEQ